MSNYSYTAGLDIEDDLDDDIEVQTINRLKEEYICLLEFDEIQKAATTLSALRYFLEYEDFIAFLQEVKDAGFNPTQFKR